MPGGILTLPAIVMESRQAGRCLAEQRIPFNRCQRRYSGRRHTLRLTDYMGSLSLGSMFLWANFENSFADIVGWHGEPPAPLWSQVASSN